MILKFTALPRSINVAADVRYVQRVIVPCDVAVLAYRLELGLGLNNTLNEFSLAAAAKALALPCSGQCKQLTPYR